MQYPVLYVRKLESQSAAMIEESESRMRVSKKKNINMNV